MFKLNSKVLFSNGKKNFNDYLGVVIFSLAGLFLFLAPIKSMAQQIFTFTGQTDKINYYSISGNVSGMAGVVTLWNNGRDEITISPSGNGDFIFPISVADETSYFVTITPDYLGYKCYIDNVAIVEGKNVTNVQLNCELLDLFQGGGLIDEYSNENNGGGSSSGGGGGSNVVTYNLNYVAGINGSIAGAKTQRVNSGNNGATVTAIPAEGHQFVKWDDGVMTAERTDLNITDNKTVTANFTANQYILKYVAGDNGIITGTSTQTINYDANGSEVSAVPNVNYRFLKWSDDLLTATRTDVNIIEDKTLTADFVIDVFALNYFADVNGSITGTSTQTVNYDSTGTEVTAIPNVGYHFVNWSDNNSVTATRTDANVKENVNATSTFAINQYALISSAGENGSITSSETVNYGTDKTFTITPTANYYVADVLVDNVSVGAVSTYTFTNVIATHTISATFVINTYTLTYTAGSNGVITGTTPQTVNNGASGLEVIAVSNVGYHFVNWSDGVVTTKRTDLNVVANISVTANFAINVSIVCGVSTVKGVGLDVLSYGTVLGVDGKCWLDRNLGATQVATAINDIASYGWLYQWGRGTDGHQIITSGVTVGPSNVPSNNFITGGTDWHTRNDSLWQGVKGINNPCPTGFRLPTSAELVAVVNPVGTVNDITNSATAFNSVLKFSAPGYRNLSNGILGLKGINGYYWSSSLSNFSALNFNFDQTGVVSQSIKSRTYGFSVRCINDENILAYVLTYTAGDNGTLTGTTPQTVNNGASGSEVIAVPNAGYQFVNWSDGVVTASRTDLNVVSNISVTANFVINTFTLNYLASANGTITGTSTQTINYGADGTAVTAVPNDSYHFVKWSDEVLTATRTDLKVIANLSVTANFGVSCGVTPIIYNGYSYPTIAMGGKCWFKENLRTIKYNDNTDIPNLVDNTQWKNDVTGSYFTPYFDGKLYNFYAVNTGKLCPTGWHIPTHNEFTDLERSVCTSGTCTIAFPYDVTTVGWRGGAAESSKLTAGTPSSVGFNVIFPGYRQMGGWYTLWNEYAVLWTSTIDGTLAWARYLYGDPIYGIYRDKFEKASGLSVRCVEN